MTLYQLIGLAAPVLFLTAYLMVSTGKWSAHALKFHVLNLLGALFILVSLVQEWNLPVCILEGCWGSISLYGIAKALRTSRTH